MSPSTTISLDISIIICCYRGEKTIRATLQSLETQSLDKSRFEVIIVDDGSKDNSSTIIKDYIENNSISKNPYFKYFRKANEGLSIARNFGLKKSNADLLVYIDEDAIASQDYLKTIVEYFENNQNINCLGGEIELYDGQGEFAKLLQDSIFSLYMKDINSIIGTNMAFRKKFLIDVGGFQPEFTYRGDETALFEKAGTKIVKGRNRKMVVKHCQPENQKAWLKTRYENGFFKMAIDFFIKKPKFLIYFNLIKSLVFVSTPFMIIIAIVLMFFSTEASIVLFLITFLLLLRKFIFNNLISNTLKELSRNRNDMVNLKDKTLLVKLIIMGVFKSEIGYLMGYVKFKDVVWEKSFI